MQPGSQDNPNQQNSLDPKQELVLKLKAANNILVTVSANPSVDQLSAAIGLTILLNKLKKHATAVFSGVIPSTIDFLKPEETLEKTTDSLRDFIIALDKSKADKLRYKVEENIVKIFITPYKTSITQDDLDFSQGDFNVDVVLALGVRAQQELDQAITAHGRILHDATVIAVNTQTGSELGVINWTDTGASSLSELAAVITDDLAKDLVDGQIATALLTGIVAETERFSNEKTSPETMRLSAELMSAGANQQLVANQLQQSPTEPAKPPTDDNGSSNDQTPPAAAPKSDDGTLEITHPADEPKSDKDSDEKPTKTPTKTPVEASPEPIPDAPARSDEPEVADDSTSATPLLPPSRLDSPHRIVEPPVLSGQLTANTDSEDMGMTGGLPLHEPETPILDRQEPETEPLSLPALELPSPIADTPVPSLMPAPAFAPEPGFSVPPDETLADLEQAVHSPHASQVTEPDVSVDDARSAVLDAINSVPSGAQPLPPKADVGATGYLNVQDIPDSLAPAPVPTPTPVPDAPALPPSPAVQPVPYIPEAIPGNTPADTPLTMPLPPAMTFAPSTATQFTPPMPATEPSQPAPPPVPPPMTELPPFVNPGQ